MNILMLTSVYKDRFLKNDKTTNIVNSFVYDWVKQGNKVMVIHNAHRFPVFIHILPRVLKNKLAAKLGFYIPDISLVSQREYSDNGVDVIRLPMRKVIPHKAPGKNEILNQVKKIEKILNNKKFEPDVIVGHWISPQMEIISELKKKYQVRTAVVLHGTGYIDRNDYPVNEYIKNIDKIGCRSKHQSVVVKNMLGLNDMPFVCYSGVPDDYLAKFSLNLDKYEDIKIWKFVYVGRLVEYKRVDVIIQALCRLNVRWSLDIVGEGAELDHLKQLCVKTNCEDKVKFWGNISRDKVMNVLSNSHIFIMVSKGEIFGLVYLEAMAASCVTIGSKGEGIDGVIVDGENGYLCKPADIDSLYEKIQSVINGNVKQIAKEGYNTANQFSDSIVAKDYLNKIMN